MAVHAGSTHRIGPDAKASGPTGAQEWADGMKMPVLWMALFSIATNILVLSVPLYLLQIYDRVLPSRSVETLVYLSVIAVGALLAYGLLETTRSILAQRTATRFEATYGGDVFRSVQLQDEGNVQPLRDMAVLRGFISSRTAISLFDLPFVPFFTAIVFFVHPVLGTITLAGAVLLVFLALVNQLATRRAERAASDATVRSAETALSLRQGAEEIRSMAMLDQALGKWGAAEAQSITGQDRIGRVNAWFFGASRTIRFLLQVSVLGFGAWFVLEQGLSAGILFAASIVSARALGPIDQVISGWRSIAQALLAWQRLKIQLRDYAPDQNSITRLPEVTGRLVVEKLVCATRPHGRPILKGLSFTIEPGECVAIIGASGAGKTTLARTLAGAIAPTAGVVRLDGVALNNWHPFDRGRATGYMAQDVSLLPDTVARNIARLDSSPDDHLVVDAAMFTDGHEFIGAFPDGYATPVGTGGVPLSGGQRQRVGLARAFFGQPRLVVLDEPNAHLDEAGLRALDRTLARAKQAAITTVFVTQRAGILARADRVMVLTEGRIELFGPRKEVLNTLKERIARQPQSASVEPIAAFRATKRAASHKGLS